MSQENEELPAELKAIEAELAALRPRADRLDRERLIFLAGRRSATATGIRAAGPRSGWAWPAAFAAMTAVAATLLVMLLAQNQRQVEMPSAAAPVGPAEPSGAGIPESAVQRPPVAHLAPGESPGAESPGAGSYPLGMSWSQPYGGTERGAATSYRRLLDRTLEYGIDSWPLLEPAAGSEAAAGPISYGELRRMMLGSLSGQAPPERPPIDVSLLPGANS